MKFLIGILAAILTALLLTGTGFSIYYAITDNLYWLFVALPLLGSSVMAALITSAGLSIPFNE